MKKTYPTPDLDWKALTVAQDANDALRAERDALLARVGRLESALSCLLNELDEHPPVTCDAMKSAFGIARAALAEKE